MPRYKYATTTGKSLVLEGETQPTDAEVEAAAKQAGVSLVLAEPAAGSTGLSVPPGAFTAAGVIGEHTLGPVAGPVARKLQQGVNIAGRALGSESGARAAAALSGSALFHNPAGLLAGTINDTYKPFQKAGQWINRVTQTPKQAADDVVRLTQIKGGSSVAAVPGEVKRILGLADMAAKNKAGSFVNRAVGAASKASNVLPVIGSVIDALQAGKSMYDFFSTHDPIPTSKRLSQSEHLDVERALLREQLAKDIELSPDRPASMGPAMEGTALPPGEIKMAGDPFKKTAFEVGTKLLQRFGTKAAPTVQELEAYLAAVPKNLAPMEQQVVNSVKLRLKMLLTKKQ